MRDRERQVWQWYRGRTGEKGVKTGTRCAPLPSSRQIDGHVSEKARLLLFFCLKKLLDKPSVDNIRSGWCRFLSECGWSTVPIVLYLGLEPLLSTQHQLVGGCKLIVRWMRTEVKQVIGKVARACLVARLSAM